MGASQPNSLSPLDRRPAARLLAATALDRLTAVEAADWRRRLERTARPCGCKSGAALSIVALVGWPLWRLLSGLPQDALAIGLAIVAYPAVVVAAGIAGKLAGILVGRWRHRRLRRRLLRRASLITPAAES